VEINQKNRRYYEFLFEIINKNKTGIEKLLAEIQQLEQENTALRGKTVNTTEAVDNINQILKNSGFMGFKICEQTQENNIYLFYKFI